MLQTFIRNVLFQHSQSIILSILLYKLKETISTIDKIMIEI